VAACDQIDVVDPLVLQLQENIPQSFYGNGSTCFAATDFVVLAKYTTEITACKENSAAATGSGDAGLLPEVGCSAGNHRCFGNLTDAKTADSVHITASGAQVAQNHICNSFPN
jgi:hypothetical protein